MIWLLETPEQTSEALLAAYLPLLDEARRERISTLRQEKSRVESALAGLLLLYAYAQEYGGSLPTIETDEHGKRRFCGEDLPQFNLSHTETAIACALSRFPVGVDVQELHSYSAKFRRILSEPERLWVEEADSDSRFTAVWTRKEAYGKALGVGIAYSMEKTDFSGDWAAPRSCREASQSCHSEQSEESLLWTIPRDGYVLSCCAAQPLALRELSFSELMKHMEEL